jgi:biotin carboxyl carrier protein
MPGLVVTVPVSEDQPVDRGDVLLILESMKMQNELKSPRSGKVSRVRVKPGDSVEQRDTLLSVV